MESENEPLEPASTESGDRKKKKKKVGTSRGVETLFRNVCRVHVEVSSLADTKANFLISVNSVLLVLATAHAKEIVTHQILLIPAAIVIGTCVGSMIFAVLVARPRVTYADAAVIDSPKRATNLLFFGAYTDLSKEEYVQELTGLIRDPELVYPAMMSDLYDMGKVLRKKYYRLQLAYGFLLYGLPTGLVLFLAIQTVLRLLGIDG